MATVYGVIRVGHNLATKPPGTNLPKEAKKKKKKPVLRIL